MINHNDFENKLSEYLDELLEITFGSKENLHQSD